MHDDFGIGLRDQIMTFGGEFFTQFFEVFNNTVVHYRDTFCGVRVSILFSWCTMRGPARMTDANGAR